MHQQPIRRCTGEAAGKAKSSPDAKGPGAKQEFDYSHLTAQHAVPPGDWRFYGIAGVLHTVEAEHRQWPTMFQLAQRSLHVTSSAAFCGQGTCSGHACVASHKGARKGLATVLTIFALAMACKLIRL